MRLLTNLLSTAVILAIVAAMSYSAYWGYGYLGSVYETLEPMPKVLLGTVMVGLILAVLTVVGGLRSAARINAKGRLLGRRADIYRDLLAAYKLLITKNDRNENGRTEVIETIASLNLEMSLFAGNDVIAANESMERILILDESRANEAEEAMLELVRAMRRDLGHAGGGDDAWLRWLVGARDIRANMGDSEHVTGAA
jgi:hypothetical protein